MTEHSWFGPASQASQQRAAAGRPSRAARGAEPRPRGGPHEGVPELRAQDPQPLRDLPGLFVFQCP